MFKTGLMNYRHAFHAGNHGDVLKHVVMSRVLTYFTGKDAPMALLDAHSGIGVYDLTSLEALKTGEWRDGIGRLLQAELQGAPQDLLRPYLNCIGALNVEGELRSYPGSPEIARFLLRPQDRLLLNELHPLDFDTLSVRYGGLPRVQLTAFDAGQAVKAALPFIERRGVVLVDPAFEVTDETARVCQLLKHGLQRMAHTCFVIWYPVTSQSFADGFCEALSFTRAKSVLRAEVLVREALDSGGLAGSGVVVVNPPWALHDELQVLLPVLQQAMQVGQGGQSTLQWLVGPA
jgi:23S rRNA (adenine2030-N6)-methyltransferase